MLSVQGATSGQQVPGVLCHISTHAPRAGSDSKARYTFRRAEIFQSTLPVRGATALGEHCPLLKQISIHAPRAGSDGTGLDHGGPSAHISIHAPRAGSDSIHTLNSSVIHRFQSTLPVRGATIEFSGWATDVFISIHAPRAGSDKIASSELTLTAISIHAPRAGSDSEDAQNGTVYFEQLS